jgi:hypothetical protein
MRTITEVEDRAWSFGRSSGSQAGPSGPASSSVISSQSRCVNDHCGTPLRFVSSFASLRPLTHLAAQSRCFTNGKGRARSAREGTENTGPVRPSAVWPEARLAGVIQVGAVQGRRPGLPLGCEFESHPRSTSSFSLVSGSSSSTSVICRLPATPFRTLTKFNP